MDDNLWLSLYMLNAACYLANCNNKSLFYYLSQFSFYPHCVRSLSPNSLFANKFRWCHPRQCQPTTFYDALLFYDAVLWSPLHEAILGRFCITLTVGSSEDLLASRLTQTVWATIQMQFKQSELQERCPIYKSRLCNRSVLFKRLKQIDTSQALCHFREFAFFFWSPVSCLSPGLPLSSKAGRSN